MRVMHRIECAAVNADLSQVRFFFLTAKLNSAPALTLLRLWDGGGQMLNVSKLTLCQHSPSCACS
jgi:hypothetical protein